MDVSGWTIDQRMRLPDWCFGNRKIIALNMRAVGAGVFYWRISGVTLPQDICIWQIGMFPRFVDSMNSYFRVGLRATVPTSEAEMDEAVPVLPDFGAINYTPPRIHLMDGGTSVWQFFHRKGMETGGKKLVAELWCSTSDVALIFYMLYSELPTNMAGWLAHHKV